MKKFTVEIQETLALTLDIEAENAEDAHSKAMEMYKKEVVRLGAENYVCTEVDVLEEK